ncbi:MAG: TonB-dependent receptor plug domain-containing protein [Nitrosomonas sp.]|nr:TonB-dependent receptor plug domain-containing protein [Nitrosomonas sp.]
MISLACSTHAQETAKQPKEAAATVAQSNTVPLSREVILNEVKIMTNRVRAGSPDDVAGTGSKTDTPLRDIPASVAVVPAAILREQGAYTMNDAMRNVSSIQPHMAGGYGFADQFTSRGLLMSFLRDGIPDGPAQNGYTRTMYDVDRIEVLKGPGSALFGAGNPGGSINMVTLRPQDKFGLSMGTFLGSFGTRNGYLDLTGPMGQRVAGRVIADIEHADGFRGLTRDIMEISPSMTWNIANNKTLRIDFNHRDIQVKPDNFGILFDARGDLANVSRETRYYTPFNKTNQKIDRIGVTHDWIISDTLSMRTAVAYDHRDLDLIRNLSATVSLANDAVTGRNARRQSDSANYTTFQNELIWKTNTGLVNHTLLGGIEYKNTNIKSNVDIYLFPDIANIRNPVITETSLSGNTNFQLFDRKMVTVQRSHLRNHNFLDYSPLHYLTGG